MGEKFCSILKEKGGDGPSIEVNRAQPYRGEYLPGSAALRLDSGLWFEFIDPESTAETPYGQCLMEGLTGGGSVSPVGSDDPQTAEHFRQRETLGRNELHEVYTIRAFNAWEKQRYETVALVMQTATAEEVAAFLGE